MYDFVWIFLMMYDFVSLCMTIYDNLWLWMPMYDYIWLCMTMCDYACCDTLAIDYDYTCEKTKTKQAQLGEPHSDIQVELF